MTGYNVQLKEKMASKYKCPLCGLLMRNPIQTFRGELACADCYMSTLSGSNICPIDGEPIKLNEIFKDRSKTLEIKNLQCVCENNVHGCLWQGTVGKVEGHQQKCQYKPKQCVYCNDENISRGTFYEHLKTCSNVPVQEECAYNNVGCDYKSSDVADALNHLKEGAVIHSKLSESHLKSIEITLVASQKDVEDCKQNIKDMEIKHEEIVKTLFDQINMLSQTVHQLNEKINETENKIVDRRNVAEASNEISNKLEEQSKELKRVNTTMSMINTNIADLDLKQQLMENSSYDSKIVWKIDKYSHRLSQATTGEVTAVHSAPGFTSKYGYKFCGRLYLNGDGMGRNTHVSLFFVLMKSEYDNLSEWPFNLQVVFRLINQDDESESVKESFIPDQNSSSFQKPTKQMNVAAGCPMFVSKEVLHNVEGFVKDDSLFIEISVVDVIFM